MMKNHKGRKDIIGRYYLFTFLVFIIILIDRLTKYYAFNYFTNETTLISGVLNLHLVLNNGAALGILQGKTFFLIIVSLLFIIFILYKLKEIILEIYYLCFALILGGAISNLYDRIVYGFVIDFIDVPFFSVFNVADTSITIGVFLIIVYLLNKELFNKWYCKKS